mgnify:FL=1
MLKIAFAGNPNVGKTALINEIAGSKLKVGNWPGVTVEKKEAQFTYENEEIFLIDLPGVYSLSPYSNEEIITRDYIINENPDLIINVVDATNLERNLYLTALLKELGKPMIIALNLYDEFKKLDYRLDEKQFEEFFGLNIVKTSARTREGLEDLLKKAIAMSKEKEKTNFKLHFNSTIDKEVEAIKKEISDKEEFKSVLEKLSLDYLAVKLLEEDKHLIDVLKNDYKISDVSFTNSYTAKLVKEYDEDIETILAEARHGNVKGILKRTLTTSLKNRLDISDKIDRVLLNKFFGPIAFVLIMLTVFTFTFNGSGPLIDWVDGFIADFLGKYVGIFVQGTPDWLQSFVVDGLIGGLGGVLVFVPLMLLLYFFLAILEESGYMSRIAFLMDKLMRSIGLNGKAFLPMLVGFGCSVPGIYATRTLEDEKSRRLTALITPLMSCGARLPVYALFTSAFFGAQSLFVVASLYLVGIIVAITLGKVFSNHPYFKAEGKALLIELPPYRLPTLKMILVYTFRKTGEYVKKAGTIILGILIVLWALMYFPNSGDAQNSYIGKFGQTVQPIFKPAGFGDRWELVAAIPPSLIAKEVVVGFMGQVLKTTTDDVAEEEVTTFGEDVTGQIVALKDSIIDSLKAMFSFNIAGLFAPPSAEEVEEEGGSGIITALQGLWTGPEAPIKAYSYLTFVLLVIPCVVTLGAFVQEFGWKMLGIVLVIYSAVPYVFSVLVYQIGRLFV